jgi:hypothetical protein
VGVAKRSPPSRTKLGGGRSAGGGGDKGSEPRRECNTVAVEGERASARGARAAASPLPCQDNHNCTEQHPKFDIRELGFPKSAERTAYSLQLNVAGMCQEHGIEKIGFLTLTFADHILDPKEAQRRLHSLTTHVLKPRYGRCIRVFERQKSGRIHYHLLVAVGADIRTGADFGEFAKGDYRSASPALRAEWSYWRMTAKKYGFGRTELLPIKSTDQAIGRYVGKYIAKHLGMRKNEDKGVRLVSYSGDKSASTRFAWAGGKAKDYRRKLGLFVHMMYEAGAIAEPTTKAMHVRFGSRWNWHWRDSILSLPEVEQHEEATNDS